MGHVCSLLLGIFVAMRWLVLWRTRTRVLSFGCAGLFCWDTLSCRPPFFRHLDSSSQSSKDVELLWLCCLSTVGHIVKGCSWLQFGCDAASSEKSWPVWNWLFRKSVQTDCNCIEDQMQPVSCGSVRSATIQPKCQNWFLRWTPMKAEESGGAYASLGTRQEGGSFEDVGLSVYASPLRILVLGFRRTEFWWSAVGPKVSGGIRETEETEEFVGSIQCNIRTEELPPQHTEVIYYNSRYIK